MEIPKELQEQVKEIFATLKEKVVLKVFTKEAECPYCKDTLALAENVAKLSGLIEVCPYTENSLEAEKYKVEHFPAVLVHTQEKELPIRFYGIPAGYEFQTLIESIVMASTGDLQLDPTLMKQAQEISKEKEILVFVTPTCPYCGPAVLTAFKLAMANPYKIKASMVEASEFPNFSSQFEVSSVPKIVLNRENHFVGNLPAEKFLAELTK